MRVRALDSSSDWTFGSGVSNYKIGNLAVTQNIQTRLLSFLGGCFFDAGAGINWFGFLSGKNELGLNMAVAAVLINTPDVLGILQLSINLTSSRQFSVSYQVQTSYSVTGDAFIYDLGSGSL